MIGYKQPSTDDIASRDILVTKIKVEEVKHRRDIMDYN